MAQFQLRLPKELRELLKERAARMGISLNALMLQVLWQYAEKPA